MIADQLFLVFTFLKLMSFVELKLLTGNETATQMSSAHFCPVILYNNSRWCDFRNRLIEENYWRLYSNEACYRYANPMRFTKKLISEVYHFTCGNVSYHLPVLLNENMPIIVDHTNVTSVNLIRKTFKNKEFFHLWFDCCIEAERCCQEKDNIGGQDDCPKTWDGWSCFPPTKPSTIRQISCSNQAYSSKPPECVLESQKQCLLNGIWNETTDYSSCAIAQVYRSRLFFRSRILYVSISVCLPAIIVLLCSKKLNSNIRMVLHRNLLVVIVLRYSLTILSEEFVLIPSVDDSGNGGILDQNSIGCRVLSFMESFTLNAMYACMLVDGFYLHKMIVRNFSKELDIRVMYIFVSVISLLPSSIWGLTKWLKNSAYCWMVDEDGDQWIVDGFRLSILFLNLLLLLDIIRNMMKRLKHGTSLQNSKTTLKATFFLIFLFGIPILLFADTSVISHATCSNYLLFKYASYVNEGLQGMMVAILFFYLNEEVQQEVASFFRRSNILKKNEKHRSSYHKARTISSRTNPESLRMDIHS